jgi:hypothetical protein
LRALGPPARAVKALGAALVLVSLALPMATCTHYVDGAGDRVAVDDRAHPPPGVTAVEEPQYALADFDPADASDWTRLATFLWPVLVLALLAWRRERGRLAVALRVVEVLLLAWSFWLVAFISSFLVDRRASGAYLAFVGLGLYALGALGSDVLALKRWRAERSERPPPQPA